MNKKLLFITSRIFWPADGGRKVSLYHYCHGLHEMYQYDIYLYSFLEAGQEKNSDGKPHFIKEIRFAEEISKVEKAKNLMYRSLMQKERWPIQCSLYYSKVNSKRIRQYCREIQPDVVMTDMIRLAPYEEAFSDLPCKKVLDMDDMLSRRYNRQLSALVNGNIAGAYSGKLPKLVNSIISNVVAKKLILKFESAHLERAELIYSKRYDSVILVSQVETEILNEKLDQKKAVTIGMGVDFESFACSQSAEIIPLTISFMGNMNSAANSDTVHLILDYVLPLVKTDYTFLIIGAYPDELYEKYCKNKNVIFLDVVDNVGNILRKSQLFLAPMAYGSGIKTKILEAMAAGVPVVTNSIGAEGIPAKSGIHFLVADNYEQQAKEVELLLSDTTLCKAVGCRGQSFVKEHFQWKDIWKEFRKCGL